MLKLILTIQNMKIVVLFHTPNPKKIRKKKKKNPNQFMALIGKQKFSELGVESWACSLFFSSWVAQVFRFYGFNRI